MNLYLVISQHTVIDYVYLTLTFPAFRPFIQYAEKSPTYTNNHIFHKPNICIAFCMVSDVSRIHKDLTYTNYIYTNIRH
ncbi:hypothetical protein GDO78_015157 [Eleutherodactylus coqui]|uniref:Uncharacterized protein n=1 Tax=Eleutherodactylus coqui TaxID=57060 RepID=A0A8J6BF30_ELECQ|nr:hypothetical protein GDO78_015157 [Eleutherodactylus coqui]